MEHVFDIPEQKKIRLIINTDAKNEADDQFAFVHALLTPRFKVKSIMAAHFGTRRTDESMEESYQEIKKVVSLMGMEGEVNISRGAARALKDEETSEVSEGAQLIIDEAMSDDPTPLYLIFLGPLTDMASAYLMEPKIAEKVNVIWIGGEAYPTGGWEFNLSNDVHAANVVFKSDIPLWQVPKTVYCTMRVSIAELEYKVRPCQEIGNYLVQQLVDFNNKFADYPEWPFGEMWSLGDSPAIGLLLDYHEYDFDWRPAPLFTEDMYYVHQQNNRPIRVYNKVDVRFILEDFFSKLALHYPPK